MVWRTWQRVDLQDMGSLGSWLVAWWHQMIFFSALLPICAGNSPVPGEFPTQRPVTRSFDVFFDLRPNKQLSKQWWGWWFGTPSWSLCNGLSTQPLPEQKSTFSQLGTGEENSEKFKRAGIPSSSTFENACDKLVGNSTDLHAYA